MNAIFFSTPTCIKCKKVKSFLEEKIKDIEYIDASTPEGLAKAKEHNVMSVPTILIYENGSKKGVATDIDEIEQLIGE